MKIACTAVRLRLPLLDEETALVEPLAAHFGSCLRCQAEAARYRSLQRSLAGLSHSSESPPRDLPALVEARLDGLRSQPVGSAARRATRVAAAAGAAVAAAGTVVVVRWLRTRAAA